MAYYNFTPTIRQLFLTLHLCEITVNLQQNKTKWFGGGSVERQASHFLINEELQSPKTFLKHAGESVPRFHFFIFVPRSYTPSTRKSRFLRSQPDPLGNCNDCACKIFIRKIWASVLLMGDRWKPCLYPTPTLLNAFYFSFVVPSWMILFRCKFFSDSKVTGFSHKTRLLYILARKDRRKVVNAFLTTSKEFLFLKYIWDLKEDFRHHTPLHKLRVLVLPFFKWVSFFRADD